MVAGGVLAVVLAAAAFVAPWEGLSLKPYRDIVGVATVCYGETRGIEQRTYSEAECAALLTSGIGQFYDGLTKCIRKRLTLGQAVAPTSWAHNVGLGAAGGSTLVRPSHAGEAASGWRMQLLRWGVDGGQRVRGLTNRRKAEYAECVK